MSEYVNNGLDYVDGLAVDSVRVSGNAVRFIASEYGGGDRYASEWSAFKLDLDTRELSAIVFQVTYDDAAAAISVNEIGL